MFKALIIEHWSLSNTALHFFLPPPGLPLTRYKVSQCDVPMVTNGHSHSGDLKLISAFLYVMTLTLQSRRDSTVKSPWQIVLSFATRHKVGHIDFVITRLFIDWFSMSCDEDDGNKSCMHITVVSNFGQGAIRLMTSLF